MWGHQRTPSMHLCASVVSIPSRSCRRWAGARGWGGNFRRLQAPGFKHSCFLSLCVRLVTQLRKASGRSASQPTQPTSLFPPSLFPSTEFPLSPCIFESPLHSQLSFWHFSSWDVTRVLSNPLTTLPQIQTPPPPPRIQNPAPEKQGSRRRCASRNSMFRWTAR